MAPISKDNWVSINLNELADTRANFLQIKLTDDEVDEVASELRVRMTFDSLYEQTDMMIWEVKDYDTPYGKASEGIPEPLKMEKITSMSGSWEIEVPWLK